MVKNILLFQTGELMTQPACFCVICAETKLLLLFLIVIMLLNFVKEQELI
ncbi:MAG: hypothetical protein PWQ54_1449 [Bacteroidales bacterium]|nr:hypothetical protein [Bacteroidales bacterium]